MNRAISISTYCGRHSYLFYDLSFEHLEARALPCIANGAGASRNFVDKGAKRTRPGSKITKIFFYESFIFILTLFFVFFFAFLSFSMFFRMDLFEFYFILFADFRR